MKPVLLYGCEIWGARNPKSPRPRNKISWEQIYQNIEPDRLDAKFCKIILGMNKKAPISQPYRARKMPVLFRHVKENYYTGIGLKTHNCLLIIVWYTEMYQLKEVDFKSSSWYSSIGKLCSLLDIKLDLVPRSQYT